MLRTFCADDFVLCGFIEGLVGGEGGGVSSRSGVVEFLTAERGGVEMGRNGENPGGRDGVEGLLGLLVKHRMRDVVVDDK